MKNLKILHLEDSLADAELIRLELDEYFGNCEIIHTIDRNSYEKALTENEFHIILSDYNVPGIHGLESLELAQEINSIPIIYVSGAIGEERAVEMLKAGATDYVLKNKLEKLPLAIERALKEKLSREKLLQKEEELKASHSFKTSIINAIKEHILVINDKGMIMDVNDGWKTFFKSNLDRFNFLESDTTNYFDLLKGIIPSDEEHEWIWGKINEVIEGQSIDFSYDFVFINKTNRTWFTLNASKRLDEKGSVITHKDITERVIANKQLRKNEQEFRSLAENAPNYIIKLNRDLQIEYINLEIIGIDPIELIGKYAVDIDNQKNTDFLFEEFQKVIDTGEASFYNTERKIHGTTTHMGINIGPVKNSKGYVEGIILNIRSRTEDVKSQEQISSQNRELIRLDEINRIGLNQDSTISDLISSCLQLFPEIIPLNNQRFYFYDPAIDDLVHHIDYLDLGRVDFVEKRLKRNISRLAPTLKSGTIFKKVIESKQTFVTQDPSIVQQVIQEHALDSATEKIERWTQKQLNILSVVIIPLYVEEDLFGLFLITSNQSLNDSEIERMERFVGVAKSVLLKKYTEKKLISNEKRYRELFENIHEGFIIISEEGFISIANPKFKEMMGYSDNDLKNFDISSILNLESDGLFTSKPQEFEIELQKKTGERFWALVTTSPKLNAANELLSVMAIIRDITDQKLVDAWNTITANIARKISTEDSSVRKVFELAYEEIGHFMPNDNFISALRADPNNFEIIFFKSKYNSATSKEAFIDSERDLIKHVIQTEEALWIRGEKLITFEKEHSIISKNKSPKCFIGVPLYMDNVVIGAIACLSYTSVNAYTGFHFQVLSYVGKHIGLFIDKIEAQEDRNRILNLSNDLICVVNVNGHLRYLNPAFEKQLGYSKEELLESNLFTITPSGDKTIETILKDKLASNQENFTFESRLLTKQNETRIIAWTAIAQTKDNLFYCIGRDVTKQLEIQKKIESSERRYRGLFERLHEGIMHSSTIGIIQSVNPGFCEMLGYQEEELIGQLGYKFLHDDVTGRRLEQKVKYRAQGTPGFYEEKFRKKSGEFMWAQVSSTPDYDENGAFIGVMSIVMDISKRKKAEEEALAMKEAFTKELENKVTERTVELENAQNELAISLEKEKELSRLKSRFVSTASHQFRTPLSVIQSNIGILSMQMGTIDGEIDTENFKQSFDKVYFRIKEQINRMTELMDDVLILGKINTGNLAVRIEDYNLIDVCENVINSYSEILGEKSIEIQLEGNIHSQKIDKQLFEHSFSNILSNAIKYSPGKLAPEVKINFKENETVLYIKDSGIGIPKEELVHLFDPFYRASNAKDYRGTGLGTSIAKEYLELMNASIEVNSTLGKGTEFIIYLKN